jgi:hypothetical protein
MINVKLNDNYVKRVNSLNVFIAQEYIHMYSFKLISKKIYLIQKT